MPNWRTAITRKTRSKPAKVLSSLGLIKGWRKLDYGCGKSIDYKFYLMDRFDPHFHPEIPKGPYELILCSYVLNVVYEEEQEQIIEHIKSLLTPDGKVYFTVRRDIKEDILYFDYSQRVVELPFKSIVKNSNFEIYEYSNEG